MAPKAAQQAAAAKAAPGGAPAAAAAAASPGSEVKSEEAKPGKAKKPREPDPLDWDESTFPSLTERAEKAIQAQLDPERIAKIRQDAATRIAAMRGAKDPAILTRRWNIKLTLGGIENTTSSPWEVFLSARVIAQGELDDHYKRSESDWVYTKSYKVSPNSKKQLKNQEMIFSKQWEGSYKKLERTIVEMEVWMVQKSNFNQIVGVGRKSLLDMANESVFQTMFIKPVDTEKKSNAYDIGMLHVNAVVSEMLEFTIVASNWQFVPRQELQDWREPKNIKIEVPTKADGAMAACVSSPAPPGLMYSWARCGEFKYQGSHLSLSMEAITITLYSNGKEQGKAIVSMGVAGEYPIATGVIKKITANPVDFIQGRIAGSVTVTSKSMFVDGGVACDEAQSSIPAPLQPANSLVLFHLSPNVQYLVVEVSGADGLPIADPDSGSSNPMCRIKYDGIVQQSFSCECTTSPAWNHTFYVPVRLPDEKIRSKAELYRNLLPVEMKSKGYLELEVWHVESLPTEYLGGCKFDLYETRFGQNAQKALCQQKITMAKKIDDDGEEEGLEDEAPDLGIDPKLVQKHNTKVYEAMKTRLTGSWLSSLQKPSISFSCFFIPDFPEDFRYLPQIMEGEKPIVLSEAFTECFKRWSTVFDGFRQAYEAWFPDAHKKRRWLAQYSDAHGDSLPLPMLVRPLALPATLATPTQISHWIRCAEFTVPPRQRACNEISSWQRPEDILAVRRGSVQDHATLLCCALMGLGKNAFVCKGTVQKDREHCWVMTREHGGTVTFWETTNGAKYHLAGRWLGDFSHQDACKKMVDQRWAQRPVSSTWKSKEVIKARAAMRRDEHLQKMHELTTLPIAPWPELYKDSNIVVVPYETIECVWNNTQLWGNLGNAHPSCIYFDMEDDARSWLPLLREAELGVIMQEQGAAVAVGPSMQAYTAETLQENIENELKESIRMIRMRQGHDSIFEEDETLQQTLEQYLAFLESECGMDSDWVYDRNGMLQKPWGAPSPFNSRGFVESCQKSWANYWVSKQQMDEAKIYLPVKENHVLSGVPLHISSCDLKEIRKHLLSSKSLMEYFNIEIDDAYFFTCVKVFPMPSLIASVWVFLGAEIPLPDEKVEQLAAEQMNQFLAASDPTLQAQQMQMQQRPPRDSE